MERFLQPKTVSIKSRRKFEEAYGERYVDKIMRTTKGNQNSAESISKSAYRLLLDRKRQTSYTILNVMVSYAQVRSIASFYIQNYANEEETREYVEKILHTTVEHLQRSYQVAEDCWYDATKIRNRYKIPDEEVPKVILEAWDYAIKILKTPNMEQEQYIFGRTKQKQKWNKAYDWIQEIQRLLQEEKSYQEILDTVFSDFAHREWADIQEIVQNHFKVLLDLTEETKGKEVFEYREILEEQEKLLTVLKPRAEVYRLEQLRKALELEREKAREKEEAILQMLPEAIAYFKEYIQTKGYMNMETFYKSKNMTEAKHYFYLNLVKNKALDIYSAYQELIQKKLARMYAQLAGKVRRIAKDSQRGILQEDNTWRDFTILDYYHFTHLSFYQLDKISKEVCSLEEQRAIQQFIHKNQPVPLDVKTELNTMTVIGGRVLTEEDKLYILEYLKKYYHKKGEPYNAKVYNELKKLYVKGNLSKRKL